MPWFRISICFMQFRGSFLNRTRFDPPSWGSSACLVVSLASVSLGACLRYLIAVVLAFMSLLVTQVHAQDVQNEDTLRACSVLSDALAKEVAAKVKGSGSCSQYCSRCGCKGGPGYRAPNGQCVSWAQLIKVCGPAPHNGCTRECQPVTKGCLGQVLGRAWLKDFAKGLGLTVSFVEPEKAPLIKPATTP